MGRKLANSISVNVSDTEMNNIHAKIFSHASATISPTNNKENMPINKRPDGSPFASSTTSKRNFKERDEVKTARHGTKRPFDATPQPLNHSERPSAVKDRCKEGKRSAFASLVSTGAKPPRPNVRREMNIKVVKEGARAFSPI